MSREKRGSGRREGVVRRRVVGEVNEAVGEESRWMYWIADATDDGHTNLVGS